MVEVETDQSAVLNERLIFTIGERAGETGEAEVLRLVLPWSTLVWVDTLLNLLDNVSQLQCMLHRTNVGRDVNVRVLDAPHRLTLGCGHGSVIKLEQHICCHRYQYRREWFAWSTSIAIYVGIRLLRGLKNSVATFSQK